MMSGAGDRRIVAGRTSRPSEERAAGADVFSPIFVVGAPRSGTTMLAVLLDRHSRISIPPETAFFCEFLPKHWAGRPPGDREEMVDAALGFARIADLRLERAAVLERFAALEPTFPNLLRAILEAYAARRPGTRPGEKSPEHILHVPEIFEAYPKAQVVCIVRDGRDVVRSLEAVAWAKPHSPRRFELFCMDWADCARLADEYRRRYGADRYLFVRYEDVVLRPEAELTRVCEFLGVPFEPTQLDATGGSAVVPAWEKNWKGKATTALDPARVEAWRRQADPKQVWVMNSMMGRALRAMGYADTGLMGCPLWRRMWLGVRKVPYWGPLRPVALRALRAWRAVRGALALRERA